MMLCLCFHILICSSQATEKVWDKVSITTMFVYILSDFCYSMFGIVMLLNGSLDFHGCKLSLLCCVLFIKLNISLSNIVGRSGAYESLKKHITYTCLAYMKSITLLFETITYIWITSVTVQWTTDDLHYSHRYYIGFAIINLIRACLIVLQLTSTLQIFSVTIWFFI